MRQLANNNSSGFSLIELITVLVISAVVFVVIYPRISVTAVDRVEEGSAMVLNAIRAARDIAQLRSGPDRRIRLIIRRRSLDIRENRTSIEAFGVQYPVVLPDGVRIRRGRGRVTFDKFGRTEARTIRLRDRNRNRQRIVISGGGYAYIR